MLITTVPNYQNKIDIKICYCQCNYMIFFSHILKDYNSTFIEHATTGTSRQTSIKQDDSPNKKRDDDKDLTYIYILVLDLYWY